MHTPSTIRCIQKRHVVIALLLLLLWIPAGFSAVGPVTKTTTVVKTPTTKTPPPFMTTIPNLPSAITASSTSDFQLPSSTTTLVPSPTPTLPSSSSLADLIACPPPLVPNTLNLASGSCMGPCCIPCPASLIFYETHRLKDIYTLTSIFRAISASCCIVLALCYVILPSRRKHPHLIVLVFTVIMILWEGLGTAWLHMKTDLLCKNMYEPATMTNSWFCGVQGIALMYMVLVLLCMCLLLIANLHVLTVYQSYTFQNYLTKLMVLSILLPLSLVLPVAIRKQIENPGFGSICFISSKVANPFFFYPLAAIVCLATLLHLGTIAFMIKTSLRTNSAAVSDSTSLKSDDGSHSNKKNPQPGRRLQTARDISQLLKQQWRPGLFALCLLIAVMIYWLFYFIEAKKLEKATPQTQWFVEWLACLSNQASDALKTGRLSPSSTADDINMAGEAAQSACAGIASPYVPSFTWAALADIMPAFFGILILIVFGTKLELWQDLRDKIFDKQKSAALTVGDDHKEAKSDRSLSPKGRSQLHQTEQDTQRRGFGDKDVDFYSNDHGLDTIELNSRDNILVHQPEVPQYGGRQSRSRSGSRAVPGPTSSIAEATFGDATRKSSIITQDFQDREPIYYRKPDILTQQEELIQKRLLYEQHAQLVTEGAVPWPSWPSSTPISPITPNSSHSGHEQGLSSLERYSPYTLQDLVVNTAAQNQIVGTTSPTLPVSSQKGFYNSEDIFAPPISLSQPSRIDRRLTSPHYPPPPPPLVAASSAPKICNQPVQSVVIPARSSSHNQGRTSNERQRPLRTSSERQPRISSERYPPASREQQPRTSNKRQPRQWHQQQLLVARELSQLPPPPIHPSPFGSKKNTHFQASTNPYNE